jgi:hypothetical protein
VLVSAIALVAVPTAAAELQPPVVVTLDGIGGAVPGMSAAQVGSLWGVRLALEGSKGFPGCKTATVARPGISGGVMFREGRWRAAWFTRGIRTPSGIRIGSTLAELRRAYGSRLTREHALYSRGLWLYYLRRTRAPHWSLRFDVSTAGRVQRIGFGESDYVTTQEGCA